MWRAGAAPDSFVEYLAGTGETFRLVSEFPRPGGHVLMPNPIAEMFTPEGNFAYRPEEIVSSESKSTLVDANGDPITGW